MRTSTSGQGRPKGSKNKATTAAREAIALFVDGNAHRLQEWLDRVADGVKQIDPDTGRETGRYTVPPNPEKAFTLFQSVVEYHIPKLSRSEVSGDVRVSLVDALKALDDGA